MTQEIGQRIVNGSPSLAPAAQSTQVDKATELFEKAVVSPRTAAHYREPTGQVTTISSAAPSREEIFIEQIKGEHFNALFGSREEFLQIPFSKAATFENLQLEHPLERGLTSATVPFVAVQVRYKLDDADIKAMPAKLEGAGSDTKERILALLAQPERKGHVIFCKVSRNRWVQVNKEPCPVFFTEEFSPGHSFKFTSSYTAFFSFLAYKQHDDPEFGFTWYLGHKA